MGRVVVLLFLFPIIVPLFVSQLSAESISYEVAFRVTEVALRGGPCSGSGLFGCNIHVGDDFIGRFDINSSLLQQNGDNLPGDISNFFLRINGVGEPGVTWDQTHPLPASDFLGFRGPLVPGGLIVLDAPSPGFNVHGGQITGLQGGVFGHVDSPWNDFLNTTFSASDDGQNNVRGSMVIAQAVPEPSTILLVSTGFALIALLLHRRS